MQLIYRYTNILKTPIIKKTNKLGFTILPNQLSRSLLPLDHGLVFFLLHFNSILYMECCLHLTPPLTPASHLEVVLRVEYIKIKISQNWSISAKLCCVNNRSVLHTTLFLAKARLDHKDTFLMNICIYHCMKINYFP